MIAKLRIAMRGGRPEESETGLTLAETVVAMGVGSLLMALVTGFTVRQVQAIDYAEKRTTTTSQLAVAQDRIATQVRTMVAFPGDSLLRDPSGNDINGPIVAQAETLGFYSFATTTTPSGTGSPSVTETWYWVQTSAGKRQLCTQTRTRTNTSGVLANRTSAQLDLSVAANRRCTLLVDNLAAASAQSPVFSYLNADYDPLGGAPTAAVKVSAPTTDTANFRSVYVDLRVSVPARPKAMVMEKSNLVQLMNKIGRNP